MRFKHKKLFISGIAVFTAGALGIGALLQSGVSVQASPAMMPGIEQIIKDKVSTEPFRILEIVDETNEAEIGWYVSGQEPYLKLYEYTIKKTDDTSEIIHFSDLKDGLSKLTSRREREEFARNIRFDEKGEMIPDSGIVKDISALCYQDGKEGNEQEDYPLSYREYKEKYFLAENEGEPNWKRIDFLTPDGSKRIDTVRLHGSYIKNPTGNGDYTKQEQTYYPIRQETADAKNEQDKYRENIKNFFFFEGNGQSAPYHLEFVPVENSTVNDALTGNIPDSENPILQEYDYTKGRYGYYEKVYAYLTEELGNAPMSVPGENPMVEGGVAIQSNDNLAAAEIFDAGDSSPFSSNEQPSNLSVEEPVVTEEFDIADTFSDGNPVSPFISNSIGTADDEMQPEEVPAASLPNTEQILQENPQPQCILDPSGKGNAGSQRDPWVYYGKAIEEFPNYSYTCVSDLETIRKLADENAQKDKESMENNNPIIRKMNDITLEKGQYYFWIKREGSDDLDKIPLFIVSGYQPVEYKDIRPISDKTNGNYYYRAERAFFCCKLPENGKVDSPEDYQYFGWYYPSYPQGEEIYIPVDENTIPTYYVSDEEYKLTEGIGDYDFIPIEGEKEWNVEVNHLFFQGGYINHDWMKRWVFNLKPDEKEFEDFNIEVTTMTANEFDSSFGNVVALEAGFSDEMAADSGETVFSDSESLPETTSVPDGETGEVFTDTAQPEAFSFTSEEILESDSEEFPTLEDNTQSAAILSDAENTVPNLEDYALIYINGKLQQNSANVLASSGIPCIINQSKVNNSEIKEAFNSFIKTDDADDHYVTQYVYFFKNTLAKDTDQPTRESCLLNRSFYYNFNQLTDGTENLEISGFEEILSYIESENQYRQLGTTENENGEFTDSSGNKIEFLETTLSQARAIEYILNYKHKRNTTPKDEINILEIQPAKSNGQLKVKEILGWMGYTADEKKAPEITVNACCSNEKGGKIPSNMTDSKDDTIWHSNFDEPPKHPGNHSITITYTDPSDFIGLKYLSRPKESINGVVKKFTLTYYETEDKILQTDSEVTWTGKDGNYDIYIPDNPVKNVKKIVLTVIDAGKDNPSDPKNYASCAELKLETFNYFNCPKVNITTMTSSEYVGHIDDINTKYDILYIGDDSSNRSLYINGNNNMLYTHVGGLKKAENGFWKLIGLYDQDFNGDGSVNKESSTAEFRGSGNDITRQQYNELMDYVKSGYLVVFADSLVENGTISTQKIDNSSYMYKAMQESLPYKNVMTRTDAKKEDYISSFYVNIEKPKIVFSENGMPPEAPRGNFASGTLIKNENGIIISSYDYFKDELKFKFSIENESAISVSNTRYDCRLYLDLNFDGNLSDAEEQENYIEVRDSSQNVEVKTEVNNEKCFQLKAGEEYTLSRKIPSDYYKLIAWKLENLNVSNPSIRTSATGYSKQKNTSGEKVPVKVLQIVPETTISDYKDGNTNFGTWDLKGELENSQSIFYQKVSSIEDFTLEIERKTVDEFDKNPDLSNQDMVVIGFDDIYENIEENAVEEILDFIKAGKSVIFAHDTTSHYNYLYDAAHNSIDGSEKLYTDWLIGRKRTNWGVSMNKVLREIVGMDRYGITSNQKLSNNRTISELLRKGEDLSSASIDFSELMKLAGDIAYKENTDSKESYRHTQGYTNSQLERANNSAMVFRALKVNDGAITQYPFVVGDSITIAGTHGQYYQLALEQDRDINGNSDNCNDIVVWYCLTDGFYSNSPKDVRNNYYFYSKGNVIYTGAGHSKVKDEDEIELFINAIVAAANVTAVQPEIHFIKELNPAAEREEIRYYMTDQQNWLNGDGNVLEKDMDFYFGVKDYNMVSSGLSMEDQKQKRMSVEIFIEDSENGKILTPEKNETLPPDLENKKLTSLNKEIKELAPYGNEAEKILLSEDGKFYLNNNNAFQFTIHEIERYLRNPDVSYRPSCKIFVKVKSTVVLYGKEVSNYSWASLDLKQRQLFDLD